MDELHQRVTDSLLHGIKQQKTEHSTSFESGRLPSHHLIFSLLAAVVIFSGSPVVAQKLSPPFATFVYPVMAPRKSSVYGKRIHPIRKVTRHHSGVDLAAPTGSPIRAVADGIIVFADPYAGYGNLVVISHGEGWTTHYGHCDAIKATPGRRVSGGEIIATVGSTGLSSGPHLHFEVRINGTPYNPENFLHSLEEGGEG